jgi:bifunctional DNase/RNase
MIEVSVARLGLDSGTNSYVLVLRERGGRRVLPIWIGQPEAESIVMQMNQVARERPLTHDLCKSVIAGLGAALSRVDITRVENNTYYAEMHLVRGELGVRLDARPSDSVAIALRLNAPIFVAESLLSTPDDGDEDDAPPSGPLDRAPQAPDVEQLKAYLERLRPEDFGKFRP